MKKICSLTIAIIICLQISAQTREDSVKMAVSTLFTAMKTANGTLLQSCFADSAILQTIVVSKDGKVNIKNQLVADFATTIQQQTPDNIDERITFETIKINNNLASVWTPYNFYYKGKFMHCGVNSFQLVHINGIWKIQYLIDTRQKDNCKL